MTFLHRQTFSKAFTIVEIVIVISVIGILAAITVVGYNGYQERARTAAAIAGVDQAADLLEAYQLKNGGLYPTSLATAGVSDTGSVTYQYTRIAGGANYCVTATSKNVSYKMTQDAKPTSGGCAGHGANGVPAITNLATNPSFEVDTTGWWSYNATGARIASGGVRGPGYFSLTRTVAGDSYSVSTAPTGVGIGVAGKTYTLSLYAWSNKSMSTYGTVFLQEEGGSYRAVLDLGNLSLTTTPQRFSASGTVPTSGPANLRVVLRTGPTIGDVAYYDAVMLTEGPTSYNFADGSSSNWVWNGTANNSTSTGPAL